MSLLGRLHIKHYPWLPSHFQNIYEWLHHTEPTWGYTIYRTTYTPQSHAAFPRVVDLTTKYMKDKFYEDYESYFRFSPDANEFKRAPFDEMWAHHKPRVIEDASQFDGTSIDHARDHFKAWATDQGKVDSFPSYRMSVMIYEESFQTLQNAPLPENLPSRPEDMRRHYVKVVEASEEDPQPPFPGWIKCSLPKMFSVWSDMQEMSYLEDSYSLRSAGTDVL
ncbi:hypothetical protein N7449_006997 [Penicillium cf. viridicatum]|uniref:Uncharacterized protein n=1 Tax=Penicillium cf. viridicatum TaxID=2972119 RepID=A0A9W9JGM1_9EURO|nr:hypothetical protein N7449_006997 [Penicillium cf. viridicatum]